MAKGKKGMMPGGGNMGNMMKQVQKMQRDMMKAQEEFEKEIFEATAGGGAVKVTINGKKELTEIILDEDVVDPDDIEMLQDLIIAAVNEGMRKVEDKQANNMSKMTGGMNIPGLF